MRIDHLLSDFAHSPLIHAVGETLLHSLWQSTLLASVVALVFSLMPKASSELRYAVSYSALLVVLLLSPITFVLVAPAPAPRPMSLVSDPPLVTVPNYTPSPLVQPVGLQHPSGEVTDRALVMSDLRRDMTKMRSLYRLAREVLPWLVGFWMAGVLIQAARFIAAVRTTQRLRQAFVLPAPTPVEILTHNLAAYLGVTSRVVVQVSRIIDVPLVVGHLRPVILLPVSAVSGLTLAQLEMLLAHELAHLRRLDPLANLLQHVIEVLFFFNPAVWWLSNIVRQERECCCDALAIRACRGDAYGYARTLATLEAIRHTQVAVVASNGGSLLTRIRRLAGKAHSFRPQPLHWFVGLVLIMVPLLVVSMASAQNQGGTLRIAYASIQQLDPFKSANNDEINAFSQIFDPLFIIGKEDFQPVPHLAESWEAVDDTTWIFRLREGVFFHDGNEVFPSGTRREVTADDVVYSINRFLNVSTAFTLGRIVSAVALDRYTVEIKTEFPDPFLITDPNRLARLVVVPREAIEQLGDEAFARNPIGSGPFKLVSFVPDQRLVFERNENYWLPVYLDRVEFVFIPDPTVQTIALEAGDVDVVTYIFNIDSVAQLSGNPDLVLLPRGGSYRGLGFNVTTPPFDEFAIRDAISKAINIDAAVNAVVAPFGIRAYGQVPPWVSFEQDPTLADLWTYDPEAALAQLAEAGFVDSDGDGILDRDGQPLRFNIKTIPGSQVRVLTILVTQLKELGIDANILQQDIAVWADDLRTGNDTGLFFDFSFAGTTGLYSLFHGDNIGLTNTHFYSNPEVNRLLDEANRTIDFETRNALWLEAQRLIMKDRVAIPLYFENGYSVVRRHVRDFVPPWGGLNLVSLENSVYLSR